MTVGVKSKIEQERKKQIYESEKRKVVGPAEGYAPRIDKETGQRIQRAKGGEVLNVPQVPVEPDQRIDKMTGMPYDQQAGTAFVDEEDPLRRMGFVGGGNVDPLRRLGFGNG